MGGRLGRFSPAGAGGSSVGGSSATSGTVAKISADFLLLLIAFTICSMSDLKASTGGAEN